MASVPRIARAVPQGRVTHPPTPISVVVSMRWSSGEVTEVHGQAIAWTREAVQVSWAPPAGPIRSDWVPAADVRRAGGPRTAPSGSDRPPHNPNLHRHRW